MLKMYEGKTDKELLTIARLQNAGGWLLVASVLLLPLGFWGMALDAVLVIGCIGWFVMRRKPSSKSSDVIDGKAVVLSETEQNETEMEQNETK